jgi:hypothetical protein
MQHIPPEFADLAQDAVKCLAPINVLLHRTMEPSGQDAMDQFNETHPYDPFVFADLFRYYTVCRINTIPRAASIRFRSLPNNGMTFQSNGCTAHVFKANSDGELYGPGKSGVKRAYFAQEERFLFAPRAQHFRYAILWDYTREAGLQLSVTCPKTWSRAKPWQRTDCHFYVEFPHAAANIVPDEVFYGTPWEDVELQPKQKTAGLQDDGLGVEDDKW